jgi:hypothetical protein
MVLCVVADGHNAAAAKSNRLICPVVYVLAWLDEEKRDTLMAWTPRPVGGFLSSSGGPFPARRFPSEAGFFTPPYGY